MNPKWVWFALLLIGLGYEIYALNTRREGDTLSETVWDLLSHPVYGRWLSWTLGGQMLWLIVHLLSRGRWA